MIIDYENKKLREFFETGVKKLEVDEEYKARRHERDYSRERASEMQTDIAADFKLVLIVYAGHEFVIVEYSYEVGNRVYKPHNAAEQGYHNAADQQRGLVLGVVDLDAGRDVAGIFVVGQ